MRIFEGFFGDKLLILWASPVVSLTCTFGILLSKSERLEK